MIDLFAFDLKAVMLLATVLQRCIPVAQRSTAATSLTVIAQTMLDQIKRCAGDHLTQFYRMAGPTTYAQKYSRPYLFQLEKNTRNAEACTRTRNREPVETRVK